MSALKVKRMVLIGFGNVGQALARLLVSKRELVNRTYGVDPLITGVYTRRHGAAIDARGLDVPRLLEAVTAGGGLASLSRHPAPSDSLEYIRTCPGDVLFENSPVNHATGQPAIDHLRIALERGMDAITANKGPVVHGYAELSLLAREKKRAFLFESAVMDGAPIFSLFREALPGIELRGFRGILNSCTNLLLERMEQGEPFDQAVQYAQSIGIAETDPSGDVDGWDAAIKVAALCTVLMGLPLLPQQVQREGIRAITPKELDQARREGKRWKLVCSARREGDAVTARVAPEKVGADSPLYSINGTSSFVLFETDTLPGLGVVESNPGPETTAYGLFADWLQTLRRAA